MAKSTTRTRRVCRIKKDIITELPRNIQEIILCCLPIRDAVRTSILSRKWRRCWTTIPNLVFDEEFASFMKDKLSEYRDPELVALKLVSVINKCLLLHNGPILEFSFYFPFAYYDEDIIHDHIDQWFSFLSKNGLKQLILQDSELREDPAHHFSSLDLTHLRLLCFWFPYTPECGVFTNLKNLELVEATSNFGQSIFVCPVLEKLTLIICGGLYPNNFCAPNLKCLIQISHEITSEYSLAGLENLEEYSFMLLEDSRIEQTQTFNVVLVPGALHKIQKFSIARKFIKYLAAGGSPSRLSKPLQYLKALNISHIDFTVLSEFSCLLSLIRSAPNLCKLHISNIEYAGEGNLENYWIEDSEDCTLHHLEIVSISVFKGLRAELELVKFLLAHSPSLKTMFIQRHGYIENIEEGVAALKITEEMLQYTRASPRAQIRHLEYCVQIIDNFDHELWSEYTF